MRFMGKFLRNYRVPDTMQRETLLRRAGAVREDAFLTVPVLRRDVKNAAPRPGQAPSVYFVSGQPLAAAVANALSPGTTAICL